MTVLVTGASGFLGRHLVRALLDEGREVVALSRDPSPLADLRSPSLRPAPGDLRDPSSYASWLTAGTTVFHLAGVRNQSRVRAAEMEEVNVRATVELARRSLEAGVGRFVHVSTALIHGPVGGGGIPFGTYAESKARAVAEIRRLAAERLPAVVVSPAIVYGPDHPSRPNRVTSEIRRLLRQRIVRTVPVLAGGRQVRNLVYVDDVVRGLLAAERCGAAGREYVLGGEEIAPRDFGRLVLSLAGLKPAATLSLPAGPALAAAWMADLLSRSDPGTGYASAVQVLLREWRFSSDKARRDLGYRPLPLGEGLARTIDWVRALD